MSELPFAIEALRRRRPGIARSFRLHRPRGPYCGRGYCQQCPVEIARGGAALACQVRGSASAPRRPDGRRVFGLVAELLRPWFYERVPNRPRLLATLALSTMRWLSSAAALPATTAPTPGALRRLDTDVLVVGAGTSGMAAANALAARGVDRLVVDAKPEESQTADVRGGTTVLGIYPEEGIAGAVDANGPLEICFRRLVVATGAYDRPLTFPGNDLPGIIGGRAFESYLADGLQGDLRIGIYAPPGVARRLTQAAIAAGIVPAWAAGPDGAPDLQVPAHAGRLERAVGRGRVKAVLIGERRLACDLLVIGFEQPSYELQLQAGQRGELHGSPPVVRTVGPTIIPLLAVGPAGGDVAGGDVAVDVERWLAGRDRPPLATDPGGFAPARTTHDSIVCFCEDVKVADIEGAIAGGFRDVELVKRRTGAATGPCQGKMCLPQIAEVMLAAGATPGLMRNRPPARPVRLSSLAAVDV